MGLEKPFVHQKPMFSSKRLFFCLLRLSSFRFDYPYFMDNRLSLGAPIFGIFFRLECPVRLQAHP